jgi:hypothetical protein
MQDGNLEHDKEAVSSFSWVHDDGRPERQKGFQLGEGEFLAHLDDGVRGALGLEDLEGRVALAHEATGRSVGCSAVKHSGAEVGKSPVAPANHLVFPRQNQQGSIGPLRERSCPNEGLDDLEFVGH